MMRSYNINLHAHTIFSDGSNTPLGMAIEAKKLDFSCLVVTDHFYGDDNLWCSLNKDKMRLLKAACREASKVLPVIVGIELSFGGEEILIFGGGLINEIFLARETHETLTVPRIQHWKQHYSCACILCHPGNIKNWTDLRPILDGYEAFNSGQDYFRNGRDLGALEGLPGWCNSDAHGVSSLFKAWNIVHVKIEEERDLIKYIKKGHQPKHYLGTEEDYDIHL